MTHAAPKDEQKRRAVGAPPEGWTRDGQYIKAPLHDGKGFYTIFIEEKAK